MRYLAYFILIIVNFILQTTFLQHIEIMGIKPNTMLILIISFSFIRGQVEGIMIGFFCGILVDIFFGTFLGLNAIIGVITAYLSGFFYNDYYKQSSIIPFSLTLGFTIFYELLFYLINILLKGYPNIFYFFIKLVLPEAIYTALLSLIIYKGLYYFDKVLSKTDRSKRRFY